MTRPDILATLQKLGLTYYGARAYYALIKTGPTNPSVIAEESEIPRTKIYGVLKKLKNQNWITIEKTRPSTVRPRYPKEVIEEHKLRLISELDEISNELTLIHNKVLENEIPKIRVIRSPEKILKITEEIMGSARNKILIMGGLYLPGGMELIKDQLLKAKKRGVSVRIISEQLNKEFTDDDYLNISSNIKIGNAHYMKNIIVDDRETLVMIAEIEDNTPNIDSISVLWTTSPFLASYVSSLFEMEWKNLDCK